MWKGRNIFRAYNPFVKNPRTEKQQLHRAVFKTLSELSNRFAPATNFGYRQKANNEHTTTRGLFLRDNKDFVHANTVDSVTIDYADLIVARGNLHCPRFGTPQFDTPQQVDVSFDSTLIGCATNDDPVCLFVYCPDAKAGILSPVSGASMAKRSDHSVSCDVPAYWNGMKVHVWGFALAGVDEPTYIDAYGGWMYPQMSSDSLYIGTGNIS
jgi:hypothetical protein